MNIFVCPAQYNELSNLTLLVRIGKHAGELTLPFVYLSFDIRLP
jgi:hypothetical protein